MKTYSIEEFFIGDIGKSINVYIKGVAHKKFQKKGIAILKQQKAHNWWFNDALTHIEYTTIGYTKNRWVKNLIPLSTYIHTLVEEVKDIEFLSNIINNIISTGLISKYDMRLIVKYLNNKEAFNKKRINFNFIGKIPEKLSLKKNEKVSGSSSILTSKKQNYNKSLGIEDEIQNLIMILAQDKCNPILVGANGVGKSTIVNELSRRISKKEVPDFLKNKKIIELTGFVTIDNKNEELIKEFVILIGECLNKKYIIFIDDIDKIFTKDNAITSLIKFYIKEKGLKVIGTITSTDKYKNYIDNGDLYKNFTSILINEPTDEKLHEIIKQIFNNYSKENNIKLLKDMDLVIKELVELTKAENTITNDNLYKSEKEEIYNPDLVVRIIDNIFAHAKVNNNKTLDYKDIEFGIDSCRYIKEDIKNNIINNINLKYKSEERKRLIKTYDINN